MKVHRDPLRPGAGGCKQLFTLTLTCSNNLLMRVYFFVSLAWWQTFCLCDPGCNLNTLLGADGVSLHPSLKFITTHNYNSYV